MFVVHIKSTGASKSDRRFTLLTIKRPDRKFRLVMFFKLRV